MRKFFATLFKKEEYTTIDKRAMNGMLYSLRKYAEPQPNGILYFWFDDFGEQQGTGFGSQTMADFHFGYWEFQGLKFPTNSAPMIMEIYGTTGYGKTSLVTEKEPGD